MKQICPGCDGPCEEVADEVDIGVGIQRHVTGVICPTCGEIAFCPECGTAIDVKKHSAWCSLGKEKGHQ